MGRLSRWIGLVVLAVATFGCDRFTKHLAETTLEGTDGHSFLADTVRLQFAENTGAFLGLGADLPHGIRTVLFTAAPTIVLIGTVVWAIRLRWTGVPVVGLALIFSGASSNLIDRIVRGSVVDFMNVGLGPVRTGIFNFADVAVLAGVLVIVFASRRDT